MTLGKTRHPGRLPGLDADDAFIALLVAAMDAITQWKFKPGRLNGKPVRVVFTLTVNFTLRS